MDTPKYKPLNDNYSYYHTWCLQVGPCAIANELRPSGILSDRDYHYLNNPHHDEDEKACKLLAAINTQVKNDPESLTTFIKAIESAELKVRYLDNPNNDRDEKVLIGAIVAQVKVDPKSLAAFPKAIKSGELKLRYCTLILLVVAATVLTVALLLLCVQFERSANENTLIFAKKVNSTYMNPATTSSKTLLNSIEYEGVKLQLPFIVPKLINVRNISTNDSQFDEVINEIRPGLRVLVTGRPGVGKSALTKHVALKWAKGELLTHCILALRISLASTIPNVHTLLDEVLPFHPDSHLVEKEICSSEGRGVCLILDALDEYTPADSNKGDLVYSIIRGQFLQEASVLVTSRMCAKLNELTEAFNMWYNLTELSFDTGRYIAKLPPKLQQDIQTVFHLNYNVETMCSLPLHMTMIVHLASGLENEERLKATDTETDLYTDFLLLTIEQYKERTGWSVKMAEDCLRDPNRTTELCILLRNISWLSYVALLENRYTLNSTLLVKKHVKTLEKFSLFGLEMKPARHGFVDYFSFAHPTFQEYLAAFYISQLPESFLLDTLEHHFELLPSENVWLYYFGIIGNYNEKLVFSCLTKLHNIAVARKQQCVVSKNIVAEGVILKNIKKKDIRMNNGKMLQSAFGQRWTISWLITLAYEAKVTSLLQKFLYETNITGPECGYKLSFDILDANDCLYLAHILKYVSIHSLELVFEFELREQCSCQRVLLEELKFHNNQISSVVNLTVNIENEMELYNIVFIVGPIIRIALSLRNLNLKCSKRYCPLCYTEFEKIAFCHKNRGSTWMEIYSTLETVELTISYCLFKEVSKLRAHLTNLHSLSVLLPIFQEKTVVEFAQSLSTMQTLTNLDIVFGTSDFGFVRTTKVAKDTYLKIGESIKRLKHLRSLSIDCNCYNYYSNIKEEAECYCANIISISAGYLTDLRKLKLSRHTFRLSNALQLKASLSELKQLTHLTLDENFYEGLDKRTIDFVDSLNQVENLKIDRWCWFKGENFPLSILPYCGSAPNFFDSVECIELREKFCIYISRAKIPLYNPQQNVIFIYDYNKPKQRKITMNYRLSKSSKS